MHGQPHIRLSILLKIMHFPFFSSKSKTQLSLLHAIPRQSSCLHAHTLTHKNKCYLLYATRHTVRSSNRDTDNILVLKFSPMYPQTALGSTQAQTRWVLRVFPGINAAGTRRLPLISIQFIE